MPFRIGSLRRASGKCDASARMKAEMAEAIAALRKAKQPLILAGGGVRYSGASAVLTDFAESAGIPVAATQAGKSVMPEVHPNYVGSLGVTGSSAANDLAQRADVVLRWQSLAGFHDWFKWIDQGAGSVAQCATS